MIPIDEAGRAYRHAVEAHENAIRLECKLESELARAKCDTGRTLELLHTATMKLVAVKKQKALGPDGGK